jgi:ABC-type multidrug transport system ATPase subunit
MLAMGRALMGAPKLLMLDEPSLGLAPIIVADIFRTIGELRAAGVSVLLVEQNAQAALKIADRAYVIELGEFILSGSAKDIASNQRVGLAKARMRRAHHLSCSPIYGGHANALPTLQTARRHFAGVYLPSFTVRMMRERSSRP